MQELTQDLVKELFEYKDGNLYRKTRASQSTQIGDKVGYNDNSGYYRVRINYKLYLVHRIIFLYHYGYLPSEIDHKDCDKLNNNIENLREVIRSQNNMNAQKRKGMSSIYKGVSFDKSTNKWISSIGKDRKKIFLGRYKNEKDAAIAYDKAALELFGEYAHINIEGDINVMV